ncbi:hypothetical protein JOQ06_003243 [Pogonophryne albipinna]|uniref:Uncharacterized protein n=1 Tax=Pogonophryne albipinna TaxID=1090488 RepID=A0AAD6B891_9TELE|nr:hypothetical protein JOQ06_003243 [Pogonophryne albipinna]
MESQCMHTERQSSVNQGWSHRAESWHRSWDQRTASPLRARRGQGLGDLCFTEVQLGCFTQQQPLRTGRHQPQDDPAHCITGNSYIDFSKELSVDPEQEQTCKCIL